MDVVKRKQGGTTEQSESERTVEWWRHRHMIGPKKEKSAINQNKKNRKKLTDDTYACNRLTNFVYEALPMIGNKNHKNLLEKLRII